MTSACADRSTATATGVRGGLKVSLIFFIKIPVYNRLCIAHTIFIFSALTDANKNTNDITLHYIKNTNISLEFYRVTIGFRMGIQLNLVHYENFCYMLYN